MRHLISNECELLNWMLQNNLFYQMYVQELAEKEGHEIHDLLINRGAHFYVCGDCKMAEDVHQKLKGIVKKHGNMTDEQVQNFMYMLKVCINLKAGN